jgi:hypothetical protein
MNSSERLGYSISIFIAGEKYSGLRVIKKTNWIGCGLVCPRASFGVLRKRAEVNKAGVYLLIGPPLDNSGMSQVYVGEGDPVFDRLRNHHIEKDFWISSVMFVSIDETLNKAKVQYVEARLIELAMTAKRCRLENRNSPGKPTLSESDEAEAEAYLEELLLCLPTIGITFFEQPNVRDRVGSVLTIQTNGVKAEGYQSDEGFVVRRGSKAVLNEVPSTYQSTSQLRLQLVQQGILIEDDGAYVFTQDFEFNSVSQAASVVGGNSASGRELWKDENGRSLREIERSEVDSDSSESLVIANQ